MLCVLFLVLNLLVLLCDTVVDVCRTVVCCVCWCWWSTCGCCCVTLLLLLCGGLLCALSACGLSAGAVVSLWDSFVVVCLLGMRISIVLPHSLLTTIP